MIDSKTLHQRIDRAVSRFTITSTHIWLDAQRRYFLDLTEDPRRWNAPVRAANTNGSILLDRYACLFTSEALQTLGVGLTISLITVGVATERSALFHWPRSSGRPSGCHPVRRA